MNKEAALENLTKAYKRQCGLLLLIMQRLKKNEIAPSVQEKMQKKNIYGNNSINPG